MARFVHIPDFAVASGKNWELRGPLTYESGIYSVPIVVPEGFLTDLASIPFFARWVLPVNDSHRLAAVVHDYLCRHDGFDRPLADRIFLEAMAVLGVPRWKRWPMFLAVRANTARLQLIGKA